MDHKFGADADAVRVGRAAECLQHRQILFERPSEVHTRQPILRTNPATGMKFWDMPARRPLEERKLKFHVPGLRAFFHGNGVTMSLEWVRSESIDEADAIDAQCRAGWPDSGYGFYSFRTTKLEDGSYCAVWKCGVSCE